MIDWMLSRAVWIVFLFALIGMTTVTFALETHRAHVCRKLGAVYVLTWGTGFKCIKVNGVISVIDK